MGKYDHIDFKPTESMAKAAQRGLDMRDKQSDSNKGMTGVGLARARQLISRETLSPETVKRMYSFFSRHEVDKQSESWKKGESKGEQAWLGWGGDAGFSWSKKIVKQMESADKKGKNNMNVNKLKEIDGRWYVYDHTGTKSVGKKEGYATKAEADKQLKAIEWEKSQRNHRVNVVTTINQSQVTRKGRRTIIKDVVPIVDDICMNDIFYPAGEINRSFESIEDTPAPIGHPMDEAGNYISANSGKGLLDFYAGAVNTNVRKVGEKVLMDIEINEEQAWAHQKGVELMEALDAKNPIHLSTGLFLNTKESRGLDVNGKEYNYVGSDFDFDHVAILLDEPGAATPEQGVGMFVNAKGDKKQVEFAHLVINSDNVNDELDAGFFKKLKRWLSTNNLLANEEDMELEKMKKALKAKELLKDNMTDDEVMNAYDKMMKKDEPKGNSDLSAMITNAVKSATDPLNDKIEKLESQLAANHENELEELAETIVKSEQGKTLSMNKDMVKAMGLEAAKTMAANCGHAVGFAPAQVQTNSDDEFNMELPE